ncbi:MAG: PepSY-associated TM helix domain-containing protein [Pseudomonadota bacterium]
MNGAFRQSMTWLHTWSGLVLCWMLYFIFVTGTLGYFDTEIDLWMTPENPAQERTDTLSNIALGQAYLEQVAPGSERWFIYPSQNRTRPHLMVGWLEPKPDGEGGTFKSQKLNPKTGEPLPEARDTGGGQLLYRMHYLLHYFPHRIGYYIVSLATMVMLIGLITGIVAHKKIFKEFFTFRWARGSRSWLDAHNLLSVSTLPFQLMITYSGLIFSLGLFWMPLVALGGYGFDTERLRALQDVFGGEEPVPAQVAAPLMPLAKLATEVNADWHDSPISIVIVDYPGDANSQVTLTNSGVGRSGRKSIALSGVTGEAVDEEAFKVPNASVAFALTMVDLHEGLFADTLLRWLYFLAGLMGTAMIATGAIYWVQSRKKKKNTAEGFGMRFVECMNAATIAGLLTAVAAYFWANRLLPVEMAHRADWEANCMFLVWGGCFVHAALRRKARVWCEQLYAVAALFLGLPLINAMTTSSHLGNTLPAGDWVLAGFDLLSLATGLIALAVALKLRPSKTTVSIPEPANAAAP